MFYIFLFIFIYKVIKTIKKKNSFIFNRELINFVFIRKIFKYDLLYQRNFAKNIILFFFNLFLCKITIRCIMIFRNIPRAYLLYSLPDSLNEHTRCFIDCRHSRTPGNPGFVVASIVFLVYP